MSETNKNEHECKIQHTNSEIASCILSPHQIGVNNIRDKDE